MKILLTTGLLVAYGWSFCQTSNIGQLSIAPNTSFSSIGDLDNKTGAYLLNDGHVYLKGSSNNNGTFTFTPGLGGETEYIGTTVQQITGNKAYNFYDLHLNNTSGLLNAIESLDSIVIHNKANFEQGIVVRITPPISSIMYFLNNASAVNMSNNSHFDGVIMKFGDDAFQYPIGDDGFYRPASVSAPSNSTDRFNGRYYGYTVGWPLTNHDPSITLIDDQEFWVVNRSIGNGTISTPLQVFLTLTYNPATTPAAILPEPGYEVHVTQWSPAQNKWIDLGGVLNASQNSVTTSAVVDQVGTYFTLAKVYVGFLPITGSPLEATLVDRNGVLTWKTYSEVENQGFEMQRTTDGMVWETIGWVDGAGNSNSEISYRFVDENLAQGVYYYRYKQLDMSGSSDYSNVVSLNVQLNSNDINFMVYPNPVSNGESVTVQYLANQENSINLSILDISGRVINELSTIFSSENATLTIDMPYADGTYYIQLKSTDDVAPVIIPVVVN